MKQSINMLHTMIFTLSIFLFLSFSPLIAQTNFVKHAGNPILPLGNPGQWDAVEAAFGHVLFDGSSYHMWYSGAQQENNYRIGYATSSDGINWNKPVNNPVLGVGASGAFDEEEVWLPTVLFDGSQYKMWYTGSVSSGGIGYATAADPTVWTRHAGAPVLDKDGSSSWEQRRVLNPVVLRSDTLYQMWYSAESISSRWQTGYATSTDGVNWSKHPDNPVLTIGANEWDAVAALAGTVLFEDGQYHMWYHGTNGNAFSGWKIGYATSPDGVNWTKHASNPILEPGSGSWDADIVGFPRVIKDGDRYRMWYTGRGSGSIDRFGYAEDSTLVGIKTLDSEQPEHFHLMQNYPNPFNPSTTIEFVLPQGSFVTMKVYSILGQEVAILLEAHKPAGGYAVNFDASELTSGIYYYTLTVDGFKQSRKMVLMK